MSCTRRPHANVIRQLNELQPELAASIDPSPNDHSGGNLNFRRVSNLICIAALTAPLLAFTATPASASLSQCSDTDPKYGSCYWSGSNYEGAFTQFGALPNNCLSLGNTYASGWNLSRTYKLTVYSEPKCKGTKKTLSPRAKGPFGFYAVSMKLT
ncbi:peptidase inhibitor family I36 protein [Streptomyces sp. NPDC001537]